MELDCIEAVYQTDAEINQKVSEYCSSFKEYIHEVKFDIEHSNGAIVDGSKSWYRECI